MDPRIVYVLSMAIFSRGRMDGATSIGALLLRIPFFWQNVWEYGENCPRGKLSRGDMGLDEMGGRGVDRMFFCNISELLTRGPYVLRWGWL